MLYSIDRFEEGFALCEPLEGGGTLCVPRAELPPQACAGDLLRHADGTWQVDEQATAERRARLAARYTRLQGRGPA